MAVSYDIYLHAVNVSGNYNPTIPWSQRSANGGAAQTESAGSVGDAGKNAVFSVSRAASFMQNPDSIVGAGVAAISKALPWVAAAYAAVKLGETVADNVFEFSEIESGNHYAGNIYRDYKNMAGMVFRPVSSIIQNLKLEKQIARENERAKLNQDLLGGSVVNSYTRRGV